jgi:predicted O-methyltransferase YrrM
MTHKYIFTEDWFSGNIPVWSQCLAKLKDKADLKFLEIGSFQGKSTVWLLENILTNPSSTLTCIDTFEGSIENTEQQKYKLFEIFQHNIEPFKNQVEWIRGYSQDAMRSMPRTPTFDFIYIDGSHDGPDVLEDSVLAFPMLKPGGVLIWDDYGWTISPKEVERPKIAIDSFMNVFKEKCKVLHVGYQVVIEKL